MSAVSAAPQHATAEQRLAVTYRDWLRLVLSFARGAGDIDLASMLCRFGTRRSFVGLHSRRGGLAVADARCSLLMGTSGSYTGSGGREGQTMRAAVQDYLKGLSRVRLPDSADARGLQVPSLALPAARLVARLLRRRVRAQDGETVLPGPERRISDLARVAGLAAAAAYAYRTGDAHTLWRLRLQPDPGRPPDQEDEFEFLRRVVDRACGDPDSTIEDHERRLVAADVADWVLGRDYAGGHAPSPVEMARYGLTVIIATVLLTECGHVLNAHPLADLGEIAIRDTAAALADTVTLHAPTAMEDDLIEAIDAGLVVLGGAFAEAG